MQQNPRLFDIPLRGGQYVGDFRPSTTVHDYNHSEYEVNRLGSDHSYPPTDNNWRPLCDDRVINHDRNERILPQPPTLNLPPRALVNPDGPTEMKVFDYGHIHDNPALTKHVVDYKHRPESAHSSSSALENYDQYTSPVSVPPLISPFLKKSNSSQDSKDIVLDEEKRRMLPAWIRAGLERMEHKQMMQREMEEEKRKVATRMEHKLLIQREMEEANRIASTRMERQHTIQPEMDHKNRMAATRMEHQQMIQSELDHENRMGATRMIDTNPSCSYGDVDGIDVKKRRERRANAGASRRKFRERMRNRGSFGRLTSNVQNRNVAGFHSMKQTQMTQQQNDLGENRMADMGDNAIFDTVQTGIKCTVRGTAGGASKRRFKERMMRMRGRGRGGQSFSQQNPSQDSLQPSAQRGKRHGRQGGASRRRFYERMRQRNRGGYANVQSNVDPQTPNMNRGARSGAGISHRGFSGRIRNRGYSSTFQQNPPAF